MIIIILKYSITKNNFTGVTFLFTQALLALQPDAIKSSHGCTRMPTQPLRVCMWHCDLQGNSERQMCGRYGAVH